MNMETTIYRIPIRLRAIREELGYEPTQMATFLGVKRTRYLHWEKGQDGGGNKPNEEAMIQLCEATGLSLDYIYRGIMDFLPLGRAIRLKAREMGMDPDSPSFDSASVSSAISQSKGRT